MLTENEIKELMNEPKKLLELGDKAESEGNIYEAIEYWRLAGEAGNTDGYAKIGMIYQNGEGVEESDDEALKWFDKVIEAGDFDGYCLKGLLYEGMDFYYNALKYHKLAVEKATNYKGEAMCRLGFMYLAGTGVDEDMDLAQEWFEKSVKAGSESALVGLGQLYYLREDYEKALQYFTKAAVDSNLMQETAEKALGDMYSSGKGVDVDDEKAVEWYEKAAEHGAVGAMLSLGTMYLDAYFDSEDDVELGAQARHWLLQAAHQGNTLAMSLMGKLYKAGETVEQDYVAAKAWLDKAVEDGLAEAMEELGEMYAYGLGVEKNIDLAALYYREAAENGYYISMVNLARIFLEDEKEANKWYERARETAEEKAAQGDSFAMETLGDMYAEGEGVEKNLEKAGVWYERAAKNGNDDAVAKLVSLNGNGITGMI